MNPSRRNTLLIGGGIGVAAALTGLAFLVGRFGLSAVVQVDGEPSLQVSSGSLYLLVIVVAALAGFAIGGLSYGAGVATEPDASRFALRYMLPIASAIATMMSYALLRVGVGGFGDIEGGLITIGALPLAVTVLVMGGVAGAVTSAVVDALARPELYGFGDETMPTGAREIMSAMMSAVSLPLVAAITAAAFTIPLSLILIELSGNAAVILFSVVGAVVLGVATIASARPWDNNGA